MKSADTFTANSFKRVLKHFYKTVLYLYLLLYSWLLFSFILATNKVNNLAAYKKLVATVKWHYLIPSFFLLQPVWCSSRSQ